MGERDKKKSGMKWSAFIVKDDYPLCYSTCLSRRCDLEKALMEEESKQGTEMKAVRLKKKAAAAAYFSVIGKTTNSVLVSAKQCI